MNRKKDFPVEKVRYFLEPGPVVMVSSEYKGERDIMTMGWHMVMEFSPSLIGCLISSGNYSFELIRKSKCCVVNLPTVELIHETVRVGNTTGGKIDKFDDNHFTAVPGSRVPAPLIAECFANFECKLVETKLIKPYNLFIFEVVKAHVKATSKKPKTFHYRGEGEFMISGTSRNLRKEFKAKLL